MGTHVEVFENTVPGQSQELGFTNQITSIFKKYFKNQRMTVNS